MTRPPTRTRLQRQLPAQTRIHTTHSHTHTHTQVHTSNVYHTTTQIQSRSHGAIRSNTCSRDQAHPGFAAPGYYPGQGAAFSTSAVLLPASSLHVAMGGTTPETATTTMLAPLPTSMLMPLSNESGNDIKLTRTSRRTSVPTSSGLFLGTGVYERRGLASHLVPQSPPPGPSSLLTIPRTTNPSKAEAEARVTLPAPTTLTLATHVKSDMMEVNPNPNPNLYPRPRAQLSSGSGLNTETNANLDLDLDQRTASTGVNADSKILSNLSSVDDHHLYQLPSSTPKLGSGSSLSRLPESSLPSRSTFSMTAQTLRSKPKPFPNSYWATPTLLACEYPWCPTDVHAERLAALIRAGVRAFIDLTELNERISYAPLLYDVARSVLPGRDIYVSIDADASQVERKQSTGGSLEPIYISYTRFPIKDRSPPSDVTVSRVLRYLYSLQRSSSSSTPVITAIHCRGGAGRTGTLVASWLLIAGYCAPGSCARRCEEALTTVQRGWETTEKRTRLGYLWSPETEAQREVVRRVGRGEVDLSLGLDSSLGYGVRPPGTEEGVEGALASTLSSLTLSRSQVRATAAARGISVGPRSHSHSRSRSRS